MSRSSRKKVQHISLDRFLIASACNKEEISPLASRRCDLRDCARSLLSTLVLSSFRLIYTLCWSLVITGPLTGILATPRPCPMTSSVPDIPPACPSSPSPTLPGSGPGSIRSRTHRLRSLMASSGGSGQQPIKSKGHTGREGEGPRYGTRSQGATRQACRDRHARRYCNNTALHHNGIIHPGHCPHHRHLNARALKECP